MDEILLLGGTGFIGSHILDALVDEGYRVRICSRRRKPQKGTTIPECRIEKLTEKIDSFGKVSVIINCVGILRGKRKNFYEIHVKGVEKLLEVAEEIGVHQIIHISALGANKDDKIDYFKTKGIAEELLLCSKIPVLILRPSIVIGSRSKFLSMMKFLLKWTPVFPFFKEEIKIAPVYVGDLVKTVLKGIKEKIEGKYDICGEEMKYREFIELLMKAYGRPPLRPSLSIELAIKITDPFSKFPFLPFGADELKMLKRGNVCRENHLESIFKIKPTGIREAIQKSTKFS